MKVVLFCGGYGMRMRDADACAPLAKEGRLLAHPHRGFWQAADTAKERHALESGYRAGNRPWMLREQVPTSSAGPDPLRPAELGLNGAGWRR
ncbi:hypothetical protein K1T35_08840 [Pseudonocardia sp. DSM 110487]|uniref:hypothetical protein n=1 Tax=Pseudonocardia sp. DSM 110487 TaxID=2865833 RepID=UPI001C69924B|nr:hypothetical protein K1T35_08840 [Pseudonocardia sp. DSM 110487]